MSLLSVLSILIGYILSYASYMPSIIRFRRKRRQNPGSVAPEARLWWLLFLAPLETIGLFGFAWTSLGPSHGIPWIAPMIFSTFIAMANVSQKSDSSQPVLPS
jgi:purine-cytosine permease-like protein